MAVLRAEVHGMQNTSIRGAKKAGQNPSRVVAPIEEEAEEGVQKSQAPGWPGD